MIVLPKFFLIIILAISCLPSYLMSMDLLTVKEVAEIRGISRSRVLALIGADRLPASRMGIQLFIKRADLAKLRIGKPGRPKKNKVR